MTELTDLSETDASNTTITTANIAEGCPPSGINNAIRNTLGLIRRAFKTSIFRIRDSTDQTKLLAFDLSGLTTATTRTLAVPDESGRQALAAHLSGYLYGLTLSNNVTDATNDIDIAAGVAIDGANAHVMTLASALTKRLDAAWAVGTGNGGLDTGSIADTTYHVWLIKRVDTGVVDVLFSASASAPTMPANYTLKRRIGSIVRTGGVIKPFLQDGDRFMWQTPVADVAASNPGTSAVTRTLTVPLGLRVRALLNVLGSSTAGGTPGGVYISDLSLPDLAADSTTIFSIHGAFGAVTSFSVGAPVEVYTNTSGQVRSRIEGSAAGVNLRISTSGWVDARGRE